MTTATDWDVRDAETGPLLVTDVEIALRLDGAATDTDLHTALADNTALRAELHRTRAELAQLRAIVSPLEAPWTPPTEQPTAWIEERVIAGRAAEHRDSYDTHSYIAGLHRDHRARWDSVHDDVEALTAHEPVDVWDDALRALTEPVAVDYSYRRTEEWALADLVVSQSRQHDDVYAELAPERINEGEPPNPITPDAEMKGSANSDGSTHNSGHDAVTTPPPDDRVQRMTRRVNGRLRTSQPETPAETPAAEAPREPWYVRVLRWIGGGAA